MPSAVASTTAVSIMSASNMLEKDLGTITAISAFGTEQIVQSPVIQSAQDKKTLSAQGGTGFNIPAQSEVVFNDFTVYGQGFGHGVGMSQSGAMGMAKAGYNYVEILKHYYSGVTVER